MDGVSLPLIAVSQVWKHNLLKEFDLIKIAGMTHILVAFDTEFPGVFSPMNIDKGEHGKLPSWTTILSEIMSMLPKLFSWIWHSVTTKDHSPIYAWEFNFRDFEVYNDIQNTESIELLKSQGINFDKNLKEGIALLTLQRWCWNLGCWAITLLSLGLPAYDIAHLMKILIRQPLPYNLMGLWTWCSAYLGKGFPIWSIWWSFVMAFMGV